MAESHTEATDAEPLAGAHALRLRNAGRRTIEQAHSPRDIATEAPARRFPWKLLGFVAVGVVPFLAALIYLNAFAADQYLSEARFAVRSMQNEDSGTTANGTGALTLSRASQDAYVVTSFIHSSEMLRRLGSRVDYRAIFDRPEADGWARLPASAPLEQFLPRWREHVTAYIDGPSGIVTLRVRAFRPEDARDLAQAILDESEALINELSTRARNDIIAQAQVEIDRTGSAYRDALDQLSAFQQRTAMLSPEAQAAQSAGLLAGLLAQKLELESRLYVMREADTVDSPAYNQLDLAARSLDAQIAELQSSLTGEENSSIAQSIVELARLETDRQVAQALYEASRRGYDAAVTEAMRKSLYVKVFVHPVAAEEPGYPNRLMTPVLILLGCFAVWATLSHAWAAVEDHRL